MGLTPLAPAFTQSEGMLAIAWGGEDVVDLAKELERIASAKVGPYGFGGPTYMAAEGVPNPRFALFGAIGLLVLGGLAVVLGAWTRIGAGCLLVFLVAATYYFHDFWTIADPGQRQLQFIQFMKNMAIGGGLLSPGSGSPAACQTSSATGRAA